MREPSLFESYNARFLDPVQVGKGFIYSSLFDEVAPSEHSLLIGPRGSGKTTFLKMLTIPALHNWKHPRKKIILDKINYIAIYVPSDFTWYPEFRRPINSVHNPKVDDLLSYALFRAHVLLSVCDTLEHLANPAYAIDPALRGKVPHGDLQHFDKLAELLEDAWKLKLKFISFLNLKQAINDRIRQLQYLLTLTSVKEVSPEHLLEQHPFLAENFFDDLRTFADQFGVVFGTTPKWAICFDEVEIAPPSVKSHIMQSARSFDQRFLIKCSASPFDEEFGSIFGPKMPMAAQDFSRVMLTHLHQREVQRFSEELFRAICKEAGVGHKKATEVLGSSFFEDAFDLNDESLTQPDLYSDIATPPPTTTEPKRYGQGGFHFRKFAGLARKDPSFEAYLQRRGIDITSMNSLPESLKAADIRKIISIVAVRDEFIFELSAETQGRKKRRKFRSKKVVSEIYTGAHAIFAICEGNPRWLIGAIRPLLEAYKANRTVENSGIVQRAEQARRIQIMITQYLSLLSTITPTGKDDSRRGILDTIDQIGEHFFEEVVGGQFNPDPPLSFRLDAEISNEHRKIIGAAMNQGAFVLIPSPREPVKLGKIEYQRVRLTHLLAPLYRLPLVLGRPVSLSTVLSKTFRTEEPPLLFGLFEVAND